MVKRRLIGPIALLLSSSASIAAPEVVIKTIEVTPVASATAQPATTASQSNRELLLLLDQLQTELRSLRGQVERQEQTIRKMESQQLNRYRDLDRRISTTMSEIADLQKTPAVAVPPPADLPLAQDLPAVTPATTPVPETSSSDTPDASPVVAPTPTVQSSRPANAVSDRQAYRDAYELVRANKYDDAVAAMKQFIASYPSSDRVTNAYFWMGEVFHAQSKLEEAREAFTVVVSNHPEHPKAPSSAYKLAVIYAALGDKARAKEYADYVMGNYPNSSVVPLVQDLESKL